MLRGLLVCCCVWWVAACVQPFRRSDVSSGPSICGRGDQNVRVSLDGALIAGNEDSLLELLLLCRGGQLLPDVTALVRPRPGRPDAANRALHAGQIEEVLSRPDGTELTVKLTFRPSGPILGRATTPSFAGRYVLTWPTSRSQGSFTGSARRTHKGVPSPIDETQPLRGTATFAVEPPPPTVAFLPFQPGEHPRLLVRRDQFVELRRRAQTPQGRAAVAEARALLARENRGFGWGRPAPAYVEGSWALGHALLYLLDGDARHAERAGVIAQLAIARNGGEWGAWATAFRAAHVALAYDLCFDVWPVDLRERVGRWLLAFAEGVASPGARDAAWRRDQDDGRFTNVESHAAVMFHAAAGLAALAIQGDPAQEPPRPIDLEDAPSLRPDRSYRPEGDVPVEPFVDGRVARRWLIAGELEDGTDDPFAAAGGRGRVRARPGDSVGGATFRPVTLPQPIWLYRFAPGRTLEERPDVNRPTRSYLYTVVDNPVPRPVKFVLNPPLSQYGPALPTSGVRMWVSGREVTDGEVHLLLDGSYPVLVELAYRGQMKAAPAFVEYDADVQAEDQRRWEAQVRAIRRAGGRTPSADRLLRHATEAVRTFLARSMGPRGATQEDSNETDAYHTLLPFVEALRRTTGMDLASGTGLDWFLPAQLATSGRLFRSDWGTDHWPVLGFPGLVRPEHRPLLRWALEQRPAMGVALPHHALFVLLNFPFELSAAPPSTLPLQHVDESFGWHVWRTGWGDGSFAAVVSLRDRFARTAITAGDYAIVGPGGTWTGYKVAEGGFFRPPCLTDVEAPNTPRIEGAIPAGGARLLNRTDGDVMQLSFVLDRWVAGSADACHEAPRIADPTPLPIQVHRSLAFDRTGTAGVPLVVAVVDRFTGTHERKIAEAQTFASGGMRLAELTEEGFRIAREPARDGTTGSVGVHIVAPRPVRLMKEIATGSADPRLEIAAGEAYFAVITVQTHGTPPPVSVTGEGLAARVQVGRRTIRFDRGRFVFETTKP